MTAETRQHDERKGSRIDAGAAGAGSGTLLVLLADALPEDEPLRPWLVLVAPAVSVLVSEVWTWFKGRLTEISRRREIDRLIAEARAKFAEAMASEHSSDHHIQKLRSDIEELEALRMARYKRRVKALSEA